MWKRAWWEQVGRGVRKKWPPSNRHAAKWSWRNDTRWTNRGQLNVSARMFPIYQTHPTNSHPDIFTLLSTWHFDVAADRVFTKPWLAKKPSEIRRESSGDSEKGWTIRNCQRVGATRQASGHGAKAAFVIVIRVHAHSLQKLPRFEDSRSVEMRS